VTADVFISERYVLPMAIFAAGAALAGMTKEPSGLLVAAAAVCVLGGRRASVFAAAGFGLALAVLLVAGWGALLDSEAGHRFAAALAGGFLISVLAHFDQSARAIEGDEREARLIVESMPGHGWSADPDGRYIYVSPSTLKYVGQPAKSLDRIEGTDEFGWRQVVHPDDYDRVVERWMHSLQTGVPYENEHRIRRFDGTYRWFRNAGMPSRDASGRITGWYGTTIDIHDQKTAELALRESEQQLQQLVDAIPALVWCMTPAGKPSYINKRLSNYVGVTLSDLVAPDAPRSLADIHPDDRAGIEEALTHSLATGEPFAMKYRQRRADGSYSWTDGRAEALRASDGRIVQWYGVCFGIDDEVRAQESLRVRERELAQLVDLVPSHVWRLTPEGQPTFFNKRMVDFLGLDVADTDRPGMSRLAVIIDAVVHPDDAPELRNTLHRCLLSGEAFEMRYRLRRVDGVYRWVSSRAEPMRDREGRILHWYGICHDIEDHVQAEDVLRNSTQRLQQMIDAVPINILSFSPSGKITSASNRYVEHVGLPPAHVQDFDALARHLAHPDDFPTMFQRASEGFAAGRPFVNRFRRLCKDGVYRWIEARAQPLRDANGAIMQWYIASIDIEDEMHAQKALRERERILRQLVETLPAMIDCADANGEPIYRSQQLRQFLGYDLEDLDGGGRSRLGEKLDASVHPDDLAEVKERYAYSLATGEPYARRHRLRRFDGEYRWVETRAAAMRNAEGAIVQWNVICLDIDAEVRAQDDLRLAQRSLARASQAASLAELSASIAHEVNQPIAAIVATSHACRRWLSANPPNLERAAITLERIIRDANSASEVVSRIRALFNQMGKARTPADITEVIAEVRRLMADELAVRKINVETEFERGLPPALIDRVQIQQVFVNLIRNAVDALDATGDGAKLIRLCAVRDDGDTIRVEVRDFGAGMKEPDRVFEPFFTTKQNGMGMGLAICRSIIESHEGRLWAAANQPKGTTFSFTLPIAAGGVA